MRSIAIVAFLALLIMPCIAVPDSVTTGPYKISFDLGVAKNNYSIVTEEPIETEALDGVKYTVYNTYINEKIDRDELPRLISIELVRYYDDTEFASPDDMVTRLSSENKNSEIAKREIDQSDGVISSMKVTLEGRGVENYDLKGVVFNIIYCPASDKKRLICTIISTYPWNEGTLSFLKTIHIEKINATT